MPKLPAVKANADGDIASQKHAAAVARVLAGHQQGIKDRSLFMTVVRRYFKTDLSAKEKFERWYEAL